LSINHVICCADTDDVSVAKYERLLQIDAECIMGVYNNVILCVACMINKYNISMNAKWVVQISIFLLNQQSKEIQYSSTHIRHFVKI
jgi:hypothetical protein